MANARTTAKDLLPLAVCAALCLVPVPVLSVPASAALLVYLPGTYALRCLHPLNRAAGHRWLAISLSFILMGLVLGWIWQWSNDRFTLFLTVLASNVVLIVVSRWRPTHPEPAERMCDTQPQQWFLAALLIWIGGCVAMCYCLPSWRGVLSPVGDYVKHHAICLSLDRSPLPLHNMFFAAESGQSCYYYDQFYLFPATLRILLGRAIPIPFAFGLFAGIVASAFVAMVYLISRKLCRSAKTALLAATCASIVGGWDLIPTVIAAIGGKGMTIVLDVWCPVAWRIHNLSNNFYWCPQHNAAALMFLLCCHLLQVDKRRHWWVLMAPLAATSVFGTSVHQAITIFAAATLFVLLEWHRGSSQTKRERTRFLAGVAAICLIGLVLMTPRVLQYIEMNARYDGGLTVQWERFPLAMFGRALPPGPVANWLDAPWLLLLDFGLGAIALVLISRNAWKRLWQDDGTRLLLIAGAIGLVTMWTIRSNVNPYDYGFRLASTFTMVVTALCAGFLLQPDMLRTWAKPILRPALSIGILLGLPAGLYETPLMAVRALVLPRAEQADKGACRFIQESTPLDAVVQRLPLESSYLVQMTNRRTAACLPSDSHVNVFRPPSPNPLQQAYDDMEAVFRTTTSRTAFETMRKWDVTHVLVGSAELRKHDDWPQFDDPRWFEKVYDDGKARVYRLVETGEPVSRTAAIIRGSQFK